MANTNGLFSIERNREVIFLESMRELDHRIKSKNKNPYNLIRKGAILRFLVIDGSVFYHVVNRDFKLKLETKLTYNVSTGYEISTFENPSSYFKTFKYYLDENGEEINIPNFLKLPILKTNDPRLLEHIDKNHIQEEYQVHELIKLIANAHGGVHIENWGSVPSYISVGESSPFNLNFNSKLHDTIDNISEVIYKILEPLCEAVFQKLKKTAPIAYETSTIVSVTDADSINKTSNLPDE